MRRHLVGLAFAVIAGQALAGRSCEPAPPDPNAVKNAFELAQMTEAKLDETGDDVVLIGRVGQDLSEYGLTYSHMGFAVKDHSSGHWGLVHKLNTCGTADSHLYDEGMVNFFSDTPFRYQTGIWRVSPAVQQRLKSTLLTKKAGDFEEDHYNMVAYPFSTKYQNSNGWVLEVLANALAPDNEANTRKSAQQWLQANGYVPTTLELGTFTRLGARVTKANIAFDDHPSELRWHGHIQTVTVDSVIKWLSTREGACLEKSCPEIRLQL